MKMKSAVFFIFSLLLLSSKVSAQTARCTGMDFQLNPGSVNLASNTFPTLNLQILRNNNNKGCDYFVVMDYGTASSASSRKLDNGTYTYPVQIYKDSGKSQIIKKIGDATSVNDAIVGNFAENSGPISVNHSYFLFIDPSTYNRFGNYNQNFNVSLYSGDFLNYQLERTRTLSVSYTQGRKVDISLVPSGGAFNTQDTSQTMDFGNLTAGATRGFDVVVGYNAGFKLTVNSTNQGKLKHTTQNAFVPYSMSVNGSGLNLTTGSATLPSQTGISPSGGTRLPVQVTIGAFSTATPGSYRDTVTFSVVSVE